MSYDRVDIPDSPISMDSIKSPQFNIETRKYIEYVGGVRIVDYDQLGKYRKLKGYDVNQPEPEPELDSNINGGQENVIYKDAITEFEKDISDDDDDENANENVEERQNRYKNKFESLVKEHDSKRLKLNESEDIDKMSESYEINENTNMQPIEKQLKSLRISHNIKSMKMQGCDSSGSRVPILPGTDSTGSYRVLLLYTTVRLSYRRSHLQRPLRS